ncbi:hypothetical protein [Nocardia brevicatena]|uniref:hypothetical protein n=1 Tax=Nocardia brevicatena TaxID=37327 RepID=UPI00031CAB9D|nr:hypothetical protein [Nocardia brevicatena]
MHVRARTLRLSRIAVAAAAIALAVELTACGSDDDGSDTATTASATATSAAGHDHGEEHGHDHGDDQDHSPAPSADSLRAGLDTFTDPQVPTADKAKVVVDGEKLTANIDRMNSELGGYGKLAFEVTDIDVEGEQATAQVTITSPHGTAPAMPMTWQHDHEADTWKLSEQSACLLLGFAKAPCVPA